MRILRLLVAPWLFLLAAGCGGLPGGSAGQPTQDVGQAVQATFQALTSQPPSQLATQFISTSAAPTAPVGAMGSIAGTLNYPADRLPPVYVTAFQVGTQNYRYVITNPGQGTFQIDNLPPGTYHVVAYTIGGGGFPAGLAGGYTKAVACGLSTGCDDHSLIDVQLAAGQAVTGILPGDWNAPDGTFPAFPQPGAFATSESTPGSTPSSSAGDGSISGDLMFPASGLPALRIVAFEVGSSTYFYTETTPGQSSYELDHVPTGTYHVVAYSLPGNGFAGGTTGGYSQMVPCGLQANCTDHTLIDVVVTAGQVTTGVNPNDYYAPPGTFPTDPVP